MTEYVSEVGFDVPAEGEVEVVRYEFDFSLDQFDMRLDAAISQQLTDFSRTKIKDWILAGHVELDGEVVTVPAYILSGFEHCVVYAQKPVLINSQAEEIDLDIIYEDDDIMVINKPAGLVVHPGAGNQRGTLLNALLYHDPELNKIPRAGIVHRLDKDTTGLMVVAKTLQAQTSLVEQLERKEVTREYEAIVYGIMTRGGKVDEPIGRHPTKRVAMAVTEKGRHAVTHYRIMEAFRNYTRLRLRLETGRTHQIRVHMSYIHHPLLGDVLYGGQIRLPKNATEELIRVMRGFKRQALHAIKLELTHPVTQERMSFEAPLPEDMQELVKALQDDRNAHEKPY